MTEAGHGRAEHDPAASRGRQGDRRRDARCGPWLGTRLADFGADVLKVEHPSTGDPMRLLGWFDRDVPLWWKVDARNKRCLTLDLKRPTGSRS